MALLNEHILKTLNCEQFGEILEKLIDNNNMLLYNKIRRNECIELASKGDANYVSHERDAVLAMNEVLKLHVVRRTLTVELLKLTLNLTTNNI